MNKPDSAFILCKSKISISKSYVCSPQFAFAERISGDIYLAKGDDETVLKYYRDYLPDYTEYEERNRDLFSVLNNMARGFYKKKSN